LRTALVLIVLALPLIDIWGLFLLAGSFGRWLVLWLVVAAVFGVVIIVQERTRMGPRMQAMLRGGEWTLPSLLYTFRRLVAGILLVFPGVLSDVVAVVLLLLPDQIPVAEPAHPAGSPQVIEGEFHKVEPANDEEEDEENP
jgi:UPF0716 protein FxsA